MLAKRGVFNGCSDGGKISVSKSGGLTPKTTPPAVQTCTNGLSGSPDPPLSGDCTMLTAAIHALAESQVTRVLPCNIYTSADCEPPEVTSHFLPCEFTFA